MADDTAARIDAYIDDLYVRQDRALLDALAGTKEAGLPAINVPPTLGRLLSILVRTANATRALEIGSLGGYSGIWIARALPKNGRLITLEIEPRHAEVARRHYAAAGVAEKVDVRVGAALDTLPSLLDEAPFDFVFIDADKDNYPGYLDWALRLSRPGTVIVGDNVLRGGSVINPTAGDAGAEGTHRFNEMAANDPRLEALIIPNRNGHDGVLVSVVKAAS